jgi:hypothetical protein
MNNACLQIVFRAAHTIQQIVNIEYKFTEKSLTLDSKRNMTEKTPSSSLPEIMKDESGNN